MARRHQLFPARANHRVGYFSHLPGWPGKDTPVMMGIKHANPASLTSSLLDIGVFLIKVPTVEDEATVDAIIDVFYYPPLGKRSLSGSNNYGEGAKSLEPEGCFVAD